MATDVRNRMAVAALALMGVFVAAYMLLYKLGFVPEVMCGASGGCDIVQASRYAYLFGIPVAAWGVGGYLAIFAVAMIGTWPGLADDRRVAMAVLGLTGIAFGFALYLSALEAWVIGAWCRWCIGSAVLSTLAFAFALPEWWRLRRDPARNAA